MANRQRGYVPIEIGGEEYYLRYDFQALARADQRLNGSLLQALAQGRFDAIETALAVGLQNGYNPRSAVTQALKDLEVSRFAYYMDRIMEALKAAGLITDEEADEGEAQAPPGSTEDSIGTS